VKPPYRVSGQVTTIDPVPTGKLLIVTPNVSPVLLVLVTVQVHVGTDGAVIARVTGIENGELENE
jgi:hypothetical protein